MPRFFFHTAEDDQALPDAEGMEFHDLETVRREARNTLIELSRDIFTHRDHRSVTILVDDASGAQVYSAVISISEHWEQAVGEEKGSDSRQVAL